VTPAGGSAAAERAALRSAVGQAFAADGPLAAALPGFVARASQRDMALAVLDALLDADTLVAEAGTGTGKTFAYLVPTLLAGGKTLVSTATRALQDQVFAKDLTEVARALGLRVEAAVLKGRQNYLCLHRLDRAHSEGQLASRRDVAYLRHIARFARLTASGDRAELAEVPENAAIWPAVTSTRENCLGGECPRYGECFVYRARRAAQLAQVVVVNHHLFLADLALRDDAIREFLPQADAVVLDEAHQLPRIAADFFGEGWSLAQLTDLAQDVRAAGLRSELADGADWVRLSQALDSAGRTVRLTLAESGLAPGARVALQRLHRAERLGRDLDAVQAALDELQSALRINAGRSPDGDALQPRAAALAAQLSRWREALGAAGGDADVADDAAVRWIAVSAQGAHFQATPLAPGAAFARMREQQPQAWILTSATLTIAGRFDAFLADIGLPRARTLRWDSPFDFARQGVLYLPQPMPSPLASDFAEQVADAAWPVIEAAGGRAFVLCSTLRAVDRVAQRLRQRTGRAGLPLLVQGESTRPALLEAFRRAGNAVLVGSVSFWEGIDVRGEALSVVAIDKLPFAPPDDPVVEARIRRLRALGRSPFAEFQLPQAVTLLKQGAGRLIRDEHDRGVLMILDDRLLSRSYGRTAIASLPPFRLTRSLQQVLAFLAGQPEALPRSAVDG
jgi:ATP-dependent DNA helicase DinG